MANEPNFLSSTSSLQTKIKEFQQKSLNFFFFFEGGEGGARGGGLELLFFHLLKEKFNQKANFDANLTSKKIEE